MCSINHGLSYGAMFFAFPIDANLVPVNMGVAGTWGINLSAKTIFCQRVKLWGKSEILESIGRLPEIGAD